MIFSKLFKGTLLNRKSAWQHKDINVRIASINDDLNVENKEEQQILLDLLATDKSDLVRRAVLLKFNCFDTWLMASEENSDESVRDFAYSQVELILKDSHKIKLSEQQKLTYIEQQKKVAFLETWLTYETKPSVVIALFIKIAKPHLTIKLFGQKNDRQIQLFLVEQVKELATLEKLLKKSTDQTVSGAISTKISALVDIAEKPEKLIKQIQLLLSKMLALKDIKEYALMLAKKEQLDNEWQIIETDFSVLTKANKNTIVDKYHKIDKQLKTTFAPKAEAHQQELIAKQLNSDKTMAKESFEQQINLINKSLTTAIFENLEINTEEQHNELLRIGIAIEESVLNNKEQEYFKVQISKQQSRLNQLPLIAQSVAEATYLISNISQLALPTTLTELNERLPIYNDWLSNWKKIERQTGSDLPDSIISAYNEIDLQWKNGLKPLLKFQQDQFQQVQKKLKELNRLIATGKFNAAFGVFKKYLNLYEQLSSANHQRLQREHDDIKEKMAELSDWEHYIATPRKQQLLLDIKEIVVTPLDNPNEQAAKVKAFRQSWNALGHAEDEIDKELNAEFNAASEEAFAPCRLYYAEQEKLREQHLVTRQAIVDQVKGINQMILSIDETSSNEINYKDVESQLNKIQKEWQGAGEVDRNKYKLLQSEFLKGIQPIKKVLYDFYQSNAELKEELIRKVQQEKERCDADNEQVAKAIQSVKGMQSQWRAIGSAGIRDENRLWQGFRKINDSIFKLRDDIKIGQQAQNNELQDVFRTKLDQLIVRSQSLTNSKETETLLEQTINLSNELLTCKPQNKLLIKKAQSISSSLKVQLDEFNDKKEKQGWLSLFSLIKLIAKNELDVQQMIDVEDYSLISNYWQKRLQEVIKNSDIVNRQDQTLTIEILAGLESPEEFLNQRMKIQVSLMQDQMLSGGKVDMKSQFTKWLTFGKLEEKDLKLLSRLESVYCQ